MGNFLTSKPGARTTHQVKVQMMHFLPPLSARVANNPEAPIRIRFASLFTGQPGRQNHHPAHQAGVFWPNLSHGWDMEFGNQQQVNWCPWFDVMEHKEIFVLMDFSGRDDASDDFAEDAVRWIHGGTLFRSQWALARSFEPCP